MVWRSLRPRSPWSGTRNGRTPPAHRERHLGAVPGAPVDPNGDYYARLADSNAVSTLNATALSGVLGMTLDGMLPTEEESAPESAPASDSGSVSAARRSGLRVLQKGSSH